jgi:hypothetical protein
MTNKYKINNIYTFSINFIIESDTKHFPPGGGGIWKDKNLKKNFLIV